MITLPVHFAQFGGHHCYLAQPYVFSVTQTCNTHKKEFPLNVLNIILYLQRDIALGACI